MSTPKILLSGKYTGEFEALRSDLTRSGYEVSTCRKSQEALRLLESVNFDLILSEIELDEGNGIDLCWEVRNLSRNPLIPFVIFSSVEEEEVRLNAYRAGVNLFLTRPLPFRNLLTRLEALIRWHKRVTAYFSEYTRPFAGILREMPFLDLVQLLNMERKTGGLWLSREFSRGLLYFEEGEIRYARLGKLEGEEAFYRLFEWMDGYFDFESHFRQEEVNVHQTTVKLILECSRKNDEKKQWAGKPLRFPPK